MLHWGTLPLYYTLSVPNPAPTSYLDYMAFAFTVGAVILEGTADQQLMDFMTRKKTNGTLVRIPRTIKMFPKIAVNKIEEIYDTKKKTNPNLYGLCICLICFWFS